MTPSLPHLQYVHIKGYSDPVCHLLALLPDPTTELSLVLSDPPKHTTALSVTHQKIYTRMMGYMKKPSLHKVDYMISIWISPSQAKGIAWSQIFWTSVAPIVHTSATMCRVSRYQGLGDYAMLLDMLASTSQANFVVEYEHCELDYSIVHTVCTHKNVSHLDLRGFKHARSWTSRFISTLKGYLDLRKKQGNALRTWVITDSCFFISAGLWTSGRERAW
jgi:hypothetical protein